MSASGEAVSCSVCRDIKYLQEVGGYPLKSHPSGYRQHQAKGGFTFLTRLKAGVSGEDFMTNKGISAIAEWLQVMWGGKPSEAGFLALIGTKNTHTRFRSMGIWDANDVLKIRTVEELAARLHVPALALFAVLYPPDSDYDLPYLFSALRAAGFDDADFAAASATSPLLPALKRVEVPDIGDGELAPGVRQEIVSRLTNPHLGISMRQIARDLGVSHETVRLIKNKLKGKNDE